MLPGQDSLSPIFTDPDILYTTEASRQNSEADVNQITTDAVIPSDHLAQSSEYAVELNDPLVYSDIDFEQVLPRIPPPAEYTVMMSSLETQQLSQQTEGPAESEHQHLMQTVDEPYSDRDINLNQNQHQSDSYLIIDDYLIESSLPVVAADEHGEPVRDTPAVGETVSDTDSKSGLDQRQSVDLNDVHVKSTDSHSAASVDEPSLESDTAASQGNDAEESHSALESEHLAPNDDDVNKSVTNTPVEDSEELGIMESAVDQTDSLQPIVHREQSHSPAESDHLPAVDDNDLSKNFVDKHKEEHKELETTEAAIEQRDSQPFNVHKEDRHTPVESVNDDDNDVSMLFADKLTEEQTELGITEFAIDQKDSQQCSVLKEQSHSAAESDHLAAANDDNDDFSKLRVDKHTDENKEPETKKSANDQKDNRDVDGEAVVDEPGDSASKPTTSDNIELQLSRADLDAVTVTKSDEQFTGTADKVTGDSGYFVPLISLWAALDAWLIICIDSVSSRCMLLIFVTLLAAWLNG